MIQSGKVKNVVIFLVISILLLGLNLGNLNNGFTLVSFAQETGETVEAGEAQETTATNEAVETAETEGEVEAETEEEELDISLKADYITYEKIEGEDLIIAKGKVNFQYQDIEINADYLKINLDTNLLFASGEIFLKQDESETNCEELTYNWETKKTIMLRLKGELTGESIKGKIYYQGKMMENFLETVEISEGSFTTCELEEPHYHIVAKEMIIYPKDKIIARNVSWYEGKIKIITLPYFLIFLDRKTQLPILPKIGQNSNDGWYAKINFNYYVNEKSYGTLYIDWFEKRGIGIGVKHYLEIGEEDDNNSGDASFYLYQIKEKDSGEFKLTGNLNYKQEFTEENIKTQVTLNYSGIKAEGGELPYNTLKSQFSFDKDGEKYKLKISGKYNFSGTGLGQEDLSIDGNIKVNHNYTFNDKLSSVLTLVYTDKNPASQEVADLELKPKWELKYKGEGYTLNLATEKRFDLDGDNYTGENISKIINRLPEFVFNKSATAIGDTKITYDIDASVGHFYEAATEEDNWRGEYIINVKRPFDLGEYLTLTPSGIFRQDVYLTGEARYLLGGKMDLKASYESNVSATLSYSYNKSVGPTPFNFDYIAPLTNTVSGKLTLKPSEKVKLDLSTNYNFVTENFGNLVAKVEYKPKDDWKMNFSSSYNLNTKEWTKKINSTLDLQLSEDWRIKYKGVVDLDDFKLTNSVVGITRDLHCREITINYKQATKSFWVEFYIKAFPTEKITIGGE
ncbi:LPS-assembly protein LptD [Candidatus Atribacteria bacterium 1244-E10-H5-B2]|nr:MAG: LPS-assembly protein LptD [Candidatus Atribacteria bacterium 1244-E10-H5-B2]